MASVTLGDVILRRVQLTAREAVTLILAVSRAWDRQRPVSASPALPDLNAIQLRETGAVSFLVTPGTSSEQSENRSETLSSLLGRLLGTDEADALAPRTALVATHAAAPDVPAVPDESFRSVLTRFADDDYAGTVATIVARTLEAAREQPLEVAPARVRHTGPERRRQPRIVAELRLDIRELERELFALRASSTPPPPLGAQVKRRTIARVALAGVAAGALALLTTLAIDRNPMRAGGEAVGDVPVGRADERTTTSAPGAAPLDSSVVQGTALSAVRPDQPSIAATRAQARHRPVTPATSRSQKRSAAAFAGGARSIDWLRH